MRRDPFSKSHWGFGDFLAVSFGLSADTARNDPACVGDEATGHRCAAARLAAALVGPSL